MASNPWEILDGINNRPSIGDLYAGARQRRIAELMMARRFEQEDRERAIQGLRNELADTDCQLVLAADSVLIAEHAHAEGYISARGLQAVKRDVAASYQEAVDERSAN